VILICRSGENSDEARMNEQQYLELINCTPSLQSLLYDVGMLPEQLKPQSSAWTVMLAMACAYQAGRDSVPLKDVAF